MFIRDYVDKVIGELIDQNRFFVSEADFQMSFIFEAYKLYGKDFDFIPEYSIQNSSTGHDEIDLVIIEKKNEEKKGKETSEQEKTFIEFKHKTKNDDNNPITIPIHGNPAFQPKNHGAQNLGRYDCWHDIERIENYKIQGNTTNGFFVFLTNDDAYWNNNGAGRNGNIAFDMTHNKTYQPESKDWVRPVNINSITKKRDRAIDIKQQYTFKYDDYLDPFKILVVDI